MLAGELALVVAALFAGAALYVSLVEHPARQNLDAAALLTEWKPAYKRGAAMQAPLALHRLRARASSRGGRAANGSGWLGAVVLVANWP